MRRRKPAPHGFAVNGNLNKNKRVEFDVPYLLLAPRQPLGTIRAGLQLTSRSLAPPKVLLITTQGRPAHLTCGQTIVCIIIPRPRSWRKGQLPPLSGQNASLKANNTSRHPSSLKREAACVRLVMALFPVSLAQAGTYPHGWYSLFKLQGERFFFPVRPIAQEKGRNLSAYKNFLIFS